MMVDQLVKVKWNNANKQYYISKGYQFTKLGNEFYVNVDDLSSGSHSLVKFVCDYCVGKNQLEEKDQWKVYKQLLVQRKKNNKDCCNHDICRSNKAWEIRMVNVINNKNTLGDKYPHLIEEWSEKNEKSPFEYSFASEAKVLWKCKEKGHEWYAYINNRSSQNTGCPYCTGVSVCKETSIAFTHPELALEWHPTKNTNITMFEVSKGSDRKVWWLGKCDHEWESDVSHRVHGRGCPYCAGRMVNQDNCLANSKPEISTQWNYSKNIDIYPHEVTCGSNANVWWICENGHEWEAVVYSRAINENGCPYCTGRKVNNDNCLAVVNPTLATEWNYPKNGTLTPNEVTKSSNKIVWWTCKTCSHEWESTISNRSNGNGCSQCKESKGEKTIRCLLERNSINFIPQYEFDGLVGLGGKNLRFDFAIFDKNDNLELLIEYDGEFHYKKIHENDSHEVIVVHDSFKNDYCLKNRIKLLRIPFWEYENIENIILKEIII